MLSYPTQEILRKQPSSRSHLHPGKRLRPAQMLPHFHGLARHQAGKNRVEIGISEEITAHAGSFRALHVVPMLRVIEAVGHVTVKCNGTGTTNSFAEDGLKRGFRFAQL